MGMPGQGIFCQKEEEMIIMKRFGRISGMIACVALSCSIAFNVMPCSVAAEDGGEVIITGNAAAATPAADSYASGNKVIIVAPTAQAAATAAPQDVTGNDGSGSTSSASIDLNNDGSSEVSVDNENTDIDYVVEDDSDKSAVKATAKPTAKADSNKTSSRNNTSAQKSDKTDEEDIPKTGVFHWELVFAGAGIILLLAGTFMAVKYLKGYRS